MQINKTDRFFFFFNNCRVDIFHTVFIFWETVISYKALQIRFTNAGTLKRYISVGMLRKTILLHTQDDTATHTHL